MQNLFIEDVDGSDYDDSLSNSSFNDQKSVGSNIKSKNMNQILKEYLNSSKDQVAFEKY